jgi:hypothetical protein
LRERFDRIDEVLAYPYGLASPGVQRAAVDAGYRAGVRISGGWLRDVATEPYTIPALTLRFVYPEAASSCEPPNDR